MAQTPDPMHAPTSEIRELFDQLAANRGMVGRMYRTLLNYPDLCRRVSDLGTFLRFGNVALPADIREMVILYVARKLGAAYEWVTHVAHAKAAGLSDGLIEAIRLEQPLPTLTSIQQGALEVADCVLDRRSIPQSTQDALVSQAGLQAVIELVVLCGFYQMIAAVIVAFDVPLPEGVSPPF